MKKKNVQSTLQGGSMSRLKCICNPVAYLEHLKTNNADNMTV